MYLVFSDVDVTSKNFGKPLKFDGVKKMKIREGLTSLSTTRYFTLSVIKVSKPLLSELCQLLADF